MEYKFEPLKIGKMNYKGHLGVTLDVLFNCLCTNFYGLTIAISIQTTKTLYFIRLKPFGEVRFNKI